MNKSGWIAVLAIVFQIKGAAAQDHKAAPPVLGGSVLARTACGTCHIVDAIQTEPPPVRMILRPRGSVPRDAPRELKIPTFMEIANRPGMSKEFLHQFIRSTHWDPSLEPKTVMPAPVITREEEQDIIGYILTLKKS